MIEISDVKEQDGNLNITVDIDEHIFNNMVLAYGYEYTANVISQKIQEIVDFEVGKKSIINYINKTEVR